MDQLMNFAWKFMLPMALLVIIVAGVWRLMAAGWERWLVCAIALAGPYVVLGRALLEKRSFSRRSYRYAE
jgi:NADH-quinone oxidoreductase subunit H